MTSGPGRSTVYPRVYGGTRILPSIKSFSVGLSPRVRGNQKKIARSHVMSRSIPACTGEPHRLRIKTARKAVYPRVYGGTETRNYGP